MLYEQGGYLLLKDMNLYAKQDKDLCERIAMVVKDFELFELSETKFWSKTCLERLEFINEKHRKAIQSAMKRWYGDANAMPTHSEGNAIKESKVKESKVNISVDELWSYFLLKTKKTFKLTTDKKSLIKKRLEDGYTIEQIKQAIDNFIQDEWPDRGKHLDLIYCLGKQKGKPDNLEKWINYKPSQSTRRQI